MNKEKEKSKEELIEIGDNYLERALDGDLDSAFEYASLVFGGKYRGNPNKADSKAAAQREINKYSEEFLNKVA